jgi:hypothetical protein
MNSNLKIIYPVILIFLFWFLKKNTSTYSHKAGYYILALISLGLLLPVCFLAVNVMSSNSLTGDSGFTTAEPSAGSNGFFGIDVPAVGGSVGASVTVFRIIMLILVIDKVQMPSNKCQVF